MALQTKTITANGSKGHHKFTLTVNEDSTSTPANTSAISWTFKLSPVVKSYDWNYSSTIPVTYTVTINGSKYTGNIMTYDGVSTVTVRSGSNTITHDTDGSKSISYSFSVSSLDISYLTGSASANGSMTLTKIPRYATVKQEMSSKTETEISMKWSSDSTIDYMEYSTDDGSNWVGKAVSNVSSGSYTISGLKANTTYKIKTRVRRKDSQLKTDSAVLSVATYNFPNCTSTPNFTLGDAVTLKFYNPLGRAFKFYIIGNGKQITTEYSGSGTSYKGLNDAKGTITRLYETIPNARSGTYKVKVVYEGSTITTDNGNTFAIKGTEVPKIGSVSYEDNDSVSIKVTGNNQHIVQNQSNLLVKYTEATAQNSATISNYTFEINEVQKTSTSPGGTVDFGKVNSSSDLELKITVTDSRGLTASTSVPVTMIAYQEPSAVVTLERKNNYEDETYLTVDGSVASVNGNNQMYITYRYKLQDESDYINPLTTINDKETYTFSLDKNKVYVFRIAVVDSFASTWYADVPLGKGVFPLFIDTALNSIGINTLPTEPNALEIEGKILGTQNRILWSGTELMDGNTTIELSELISKQMSGIVLVWTPYDSTSGGQNVACNYTYVPKIHTLLNIGNSVVCRMSGGNPFRYQGSKYVFIYDDKISGSGYNINTGTGDSGVIYHNEMYALRYVIGV